jgi:photosystem II stability/assembly factor-like uncharacterized protein
MKKIKILILVILCLLNTGILFSQVSKVVFKYGWYETPSPTSNTLNGIYLYVNDPFAYGNAGSVFKKDFNAITWADRSVPANFIINGMINIQTGTFVVGNAGKVYRSTNLGVNWTQFLSTYNPSSNPTFNINSVWSNDANYLWIVGDAGHYAYGKNIGALSIFEWFHYPTGTTQRLNSIYGGFVDGTNGILLAVGDNGTILKSVYPYTSMTVKPSGTTANLYCITKTNNGSGTQFAIAVGANGTILRSTDFGETWTQSVSNTGNDLYSVSYLVEIGFVCGANGTILRDNYGNSTNRGVNWVQQTSHTTESLFGISGTTGDEAYAVGNGGIILRTTTGGISFISDPSTLKPSFNIEQNRPNPFNPTTNIKFTISKSGWVKLTVYDILGKKVATLVNDNLKAGTFNVNFDAASLTSGVYFYKMESEEFSEIKKMTLLK